MRVIADHARATAFLVADGVLPSNEGRGYVLRRIMRRAIRHGEENLDLDQPFFHEAVDAVITLMGEAYPELQEKRAFLLEVARHEEESFRRTLRRGLGLIQVELNRLAAAQEKMISGAVVWDLHQTHGFPWDLTQVIAREHGVDIDQAGFEKLLEIGREKASAGSLGSDKAVADVYLKVAGQVGESRFLGYEATEAQGKVVSLLKGGHEVQVATAGDEVEVVLDQTPFYGESGGQVGDHGVLSSGAATVQVIDTQKPVAGLHVHRGTLSGGRLAIGDVVTAKVDTVRRDRIRANHSATHLLHKALKVVLGPAVNQKGSVVSPEALRFDFSHFSAMSQDEIEQVEDLVNGWVRDNQGADTRVMAIADARAAGAVALFGEKYGEKVRVVTVHPESTELCGGTHVRRTGDIGLFRVTQESSIASGVRRITALTGAEAVLYAREQEHLLRRAAELYKSAPADLAKRIEAGQKRVKELEKKLEESQLKAQQGGGKAADQVQVINGIKVLTQRVDPADATILRALADRYRDQLQSGVIGLGGETADGKALILVAATKDLVEKGFKSGDAVRLMAAEVGGKGGGKPEMAQAGGSDPSRIPQAFEKLYAMVKGS